MSLKRILVIASSVTLSLTCKPRSFNESNSSQVQSYLGYFDPNGDSVQHAICALEDAGWPKANVPNPYGSSIEANRKLMDEFLCISYYESSLNPESFNYVEVPEGGFRHHVGLWQVQWPTHAGRSVEYHGQTYSCPASPNTMEDLFDPYINAQCALFIYAERAKAGVDIMSAWEGVCRDMPPPPVDCSYKAVARQDVPIVVNPSPKPKPVAKPKPRPICRPKIDIGTSSQGDFLSFKTNFTGDCKEASYMTIHMYDAEGRRNIETLQMFKDTLNSVRGLKSEMALLNKKRLDVTSAELKKINQRRIELATQIKLANTKLAAPKRQMPIYESANLVPNNKNVKVKLQRTSKGFQAYPYVYWKDVQAYSANDEFFIFSIYNSKNALIGSKLMRTAVPQPILKRFSK